MFIQGAMFIQGGTFIPDSRVLKWPIFTQAGKIGSDKNNKSNKPTGRNALIPKGWKSLKLGLKLVECHFKCQSLTESK